MIRKNLRFIKERFYFLKYLLSTRKLRKSNISLDKLSYNKIYRLEIPTYDGSGQAVHPDILIQNMQPEYIIVFTPYPDTIDKYENPSILVSNNGIKFHEEESGLNPLVPCPEIDHNDDPDIILENNVYNIIYLETLRPEKQNICLLRSSDRINWKKMIIHTEDLISTSDKFMLSPSLIHYNDSTLLYYVNKNTKTGHRIEYIKGDNIENLNFDEIILPNMQDMNFVPWHVDVIKDENSVYYMLISAVTKINGINSYSLHIAKSHNMHDWVISEHTLLENCYRSTGFIRNNDIYIYISRNIYQRKWRIELLKKSLPEF